MRGDFGSLGRLNVKTRPPLSLYSGFSILLVFSRLSSFYVFGDFPLIWGFSIAIHTRIHHCFSVTFFLVLTCRSPTFQLRFPSGSNIWLRLWLVDCTNVSNNKCNFFPVLDPYRLVISFIAFI